MTTRVNPGGLFATTPLLIDPQADKQRLNQVNRNQNNQYFNPRPVQHQTTTQQFHQYQPNAPAFNKGNQPQVPGGRHPHQNFRANQGKYNYNNIQQSRPPLAVPVLQNFAKKKIQNQYQKKPPFIPPQNLYQYPNQKSFQPQGMHNKNNRPFINRNQPEGEKNYPKQKQYPHLNQRQNNQRNFDKIKPQVFGIQKSGLKDKPYGKNDKRKEIKEKNVDKQEKRSDQQQQYDQQQYEQQEQVDYDSKEESQYQNQEQEYSGQEYQQQQQQQREQNEQEQFQQKQQNVEQLSEQEIHQNSQSQKQKSIPKKKQKIKQLNNKNLPVLNIQSSNLDDEILLERCETMCPKQEFMDRKNIFKQNNRGETMKLDNQHSFSFFQISRKTREPSENLVIKRFKRSVITQNDQVQQKQLVRTPKALISTMQYILKNIVDSDNTDIEKHPFIDPVQTENITFVDIHEFLWNRLRGVIRDISQLSTKEQRSKQIITLSQYITRFFILSINERRRFEMFDEKMNMQNLEKIITPLLESYKHNKMELKRLFNEMATQKNFSQDMLASQIQNRAIYISPYEPQITSYALVISNQRNNGKLEQIYGMFKQCEVNPLLQSQAIQNAFEMRYCISSHNFVKYFQLIQKENISLLLSSSLLFHITSIRKSAINTILKCWKQKNDDKMEMWSFNLINQYLGFKNNLEQMKKFLKFIGTKLNMDQTAIIGKQLGKQQYIVYHVPNYEFASNKKDRKYYKNPKKIKKTYTQNQITRQQLLRGVGIDHKNYDKQVIKALKNYYWNKLQNSEEVEQQSEEAVQLVQEIQKSVQQEQIKQQQIIKQIKPDQNLQQIKKLQLKIKKKKFLEKIQKKIQKLFRNCISRTVKKKQIINKMFTIVQSKVKKQKQTTFYKILYYEETKTFLAYYFNKFRNIIYKNKEFKSHLKISSNQFTSFQYIRLKADQQKSSNAMYNVEYELNKNNFYNYLIQIFCRIPEEILNNLHEYQFNITLIFHQNELRDKKSATYFQQIINFLSNHKSQTFFRKFIQSKDSTFSYNSLIKFNTDKGFKKIISYDIKLIKINNEQTFKHIIENQLYGTDLLIAPQISESLWLIKHLNALIRNNSSFRMQSIHLMIIKGSHSNQDRNLSHYLEKFPLPKQFKNVYLSQVLLSKGLLCLQTKFTLKQALKQIIQYKPFFPPLQIVPMVNIIATIKKNLQFLKGIKKEEKKKFLYYQQYLNECFEQVWQFQSMIFEKRQMILKWKSIILMLVQYYQNNQQGTDINQSHQFLINKLFETFLLDFVNQKYFNSINKKEYLSNLIISYINNFKDEDEVDHAFLSRIMEHFRNTPILHDLLTIDENIEKLFIILLDQLISIFEQCQVKMVLPENFRFLIEVEEFHQRVNIKYSKIIETLKMKKIEKLNRLEITPKARKRKTNVHEIPAKNIDIDIKLRHQDIFDQISKRRKLQKIDTL